MPSLSGYGRTSGAVHRIGLQPAWSPEYRRPALGGRVADRLRSLIQATCAERGWTLQELGVMSGPDAFPVLVPHHRKVLTFRARHAEFPHLRSRLPMLWPRSYLVASVGRVSEATIRGYIAEQTTRPEKGKP